MNKRFWGALSTYSALGVLAGFTLSGPIRGATLLFLGGLALKTWIARLQAAGKPKD